MPLTLITGPANAAKAGAVFERLRAALPRDPLLVVPTSADREHYQRELAASGIVFGAEVVTFERLVREIAGAAGLTVRPLGPVARERVVRAAVAGVPLQALARSAATPGFARAAGRAVRRAAALAGRPGAVHVGAARVGGRRPRRATPGSSPRSTPPTAAGWSGWGGPTARATRGRRWTRCAPRRRRGAAARSSSTASTT